LKKLYCTFAGGCPGRAGPYIVVAPVRQIPLQVRGPCRSQLSRVIFAPSGTGTADRPEPC